MVYFHGDLSQAQRIRIMNKIRLKLVKIIIATDVLSRGIDLESVDLVINFSDPYNPENYYHRIGRTARYGKFGVSFLMMNKKKKQTWLKENQNFTQGNVKDGQLKSESQSKQSAFSSYQWKFEDWDESKLEEINSKLREKKKLIEAEHKKTKEDKSIVEKVELPSWIDAEVQHINADKFKFKTRKHEQAKTVEKRPKKFIEPQNEPISDLPQAADATNNTEEHIEQKKFEYEMLMMEIERLEKEERDLLGLKKGEQLSALHFDCNGEDNDSRPLIGKRVTINAQIENEPQKQLKKSHVETNSNEFQADFETFKQLFMMMENPFLVENMERVHHLQITPESNSTAHNSVFLSLVDEHLG